MSLNESLQALTEAFVASMIEAISGCSLDDLAGVQGMHSAPARPKLAASTERHTPKASKTPKGAKMGRMPRRSLEQLQEAAADVVALLRKNKGGLRAEDIRTELNLDKREVPRTLKQALSDKLIVVASGQKRSTLYVVKGAGVKAAGKTKTGSKGVKAKSTKTKAQKAKAAPRKAKAAPRKAVQHKAAAPKSKKVSRKAKPAKAAKAATEHVSNGVGALHEAAPDA